MSAEPKQRDVVVTRVFDALVALVWKAWSDPAQVMRWWGPTGFTSLTCKMDFREGGNLAGLYAYSCTLAMLEQMCLNHELGHTNHSLKLA
jgi:hypothetical protein